MPAATEDAAMTAGKLGLLRDWPPESGPPRVPVHWAVATATHGVEPEAWFRYHYCTKTHTY